MKNNIKTLFRSKLLDFKNPSKAMGGEFILGPLIKMPFFSIFYAIPSKKKTNLFGVE